MQYDAILKPLTIKTVTIRNRIMSTAHTSGAGEDGKPKERYQAYHEEKAKGGIGMTMIGGSTAVAPDSPGADMLHLDASNDDIIPYYRQLADRIHKHGAAVFAQLAHMGRRANWDNDRWLVPICPSRVREPAHHSNPREMEDWDFRRLVKAFASAAGRIKQGGMDGVELSATHGHLLDQFWSPRVNKRCDRYGGSIENRLRFALEVIDAVRTEVGDDFIVGLRMSADELIDGGLTLDDCIEIAQTLTNQGRLDYLSVLAGQAENLPAHATIFPNMSMPPAPYLPLAGTIKANIDVPLFHAQRISDLATAARAVSEGLVDMVAMTRPHLADPHIVKKLMEGRVDDIRPCVGANYCIDRLYSGGQAYCLHNASTGRELTLPHQIQRAATRKKVVIVGAGVAGLEAARVCAERGHEVVLFESGSQAGGQLNLASKVAWREPLTAIYRWLELQVRKRNVEVRLNTLADVSLIRAQKPDVVILATGGRPSLAAIEGSALAASTWDILEGRVEVGGYVLMFDDNGGEAALSCAEFMCDRGSKIEFVTADDRAGALLERTTRPTFLQRLYDRDVIFTPDHRLACIQKGANELIALLHNEYNGRDEERVVSQVVVECGVAPDDRLYESLKPYSLNLGEVDLLALTEGRAQTLVNAPEQDFFLFRIGDAVAGRNIHAAILDAMRLCREM